MCKRSERICFGDKCAKGPNGKTSAQSLTRSKVRIPIVGTVKDGRVETKIGQRRFIVVTAVGSCLEEGATADPGSGVSSYVFLPVTESINWASPE